MVRAGLACAWLACAWLACAWLACAWLAGGAGAALAQDEAATPPSPDAPSAVSPSASPTRGTDARDDDRFVVATKVAPPFAMRGEDGTWSGVSISLWEHLAQELDLDWRFEEASLGDMIVGVADGRFDASIAAMTITPARERLVDFSHPFYSTGFGIAVPRRDVSVWQMIKSLVSPAFLKVIGLLALLLAFVGFVFWLAERRRNTEEFRPGLQGLGDGFWFSAVTMTTTGYGDMAPRTNVGRFIALIWMFTALLITSTFTGLIASSLTAERLSLVVEGPTDLPNVSTGSIAGSTSDEWLSGQGLVFLDYPSVEAGLIALEDGEIETFVYDRPLLAFLAERAHPDTLTLVPGAFGRQDYGVALPSGSAWREPLNQALLRYLDSDDWTALLTRWLGPHG